MARFILDIANINTSEEMNDLRERLINHLIDKIATLNCIDDGNENQFHDDESLNVLSDAQIKRDIKNHYTIFFNDNIGKEIKEGDEVIYIGTDEVEETVDCDWRGDRLIVKECLDVDSNYIGFYNITKKEEGQFYGHRVLKIN
tara:strand:+ start:260 stop:688 length:429 start_codon:yes stop_codon:yes gene_type:complete